MSTNVILTQAGPVARIRFEAANEIHILSSATRRSLSETLTKLDADEGCRIIIFEARGRTFLAGAELSELQDLNEESALKYARSGQALMNQIARLRATTICVIQGPCAGGGCELALACDFRLAATSARIGLPETSLGLIPGWGGTVRTTLLLGAAAARRLILSGELLPAEEAQWVGLVDRVVTDSELDQVVEKLVAQWLTRAPQAVQRAKRLIAQLSREGFKKALSREARQFAACYTTGEPAIGIASFKEKRRASWSPVIVTEPPKLEPTKAKPKPKPKRKKHPTPTVRQRTNSKRTTSTKPRRRTKPKQR